MKKVLIIGGSLAVVGGLVYLYLKNKKKTDELLSGGTLDSPQTVSGQTTAGIANQGVGSSPINFVKFFRDAKRSKTNKSISSYDFKA